MSNLDNILNKKHEEKEKCVSSLFRTDIIGMNQPENKPDRKRFFEELFWRSEYAFGSDILDFILSDHEPPIYRK